MPDILSRRDSPACKGAPRCNCESVVVHGGTAATGARAAVLSSPSSWKAALASINVQAPLPLWLGTLRLTRLRQRSIVGICGSRLTGQMLRPPPRSRSHSEQPPEEISAH